MSCAIRDMHRATTRPLTRRLLLLAGSAAALTVRARPPATPPPEVAANLPSARLQGEGRMTFLGVHVYDARLWVGPTFAANAFEQEGLALELQYGRALDGLRIAERSLAEMKKVGPVTPEQSRRWLAETTALFPDVEKGDRITGLQHPGESARFFLNGRLRGEVRDPAFARLFFGIWLSERSSEPALRRSLLGAVA